MPAIWTGCPLGRCRGELRYTPHSARHCLAQLGDRLCRTGEERKAWSLNFGHENESITWKHYGNVSLSRRAEIFEAFEVIDRADEGELRQMLEDPDLRQVLEALWRVRQKSDGVSS